MPVYFDPSEREERLNLIEGLMRTPTTPLQSPLENQLTEALAWLIDRAPVFGRRFASLFFEGDAKVVAAITTCADIGASTRVPLPSLPGTGTPRPDLAITGSGRSFQLLVEAKVDAPLHHYELDGELVGQVETYILAWQTADPAFEARVRGVGTLTRAREGPHRDGPLRAADVTWAAVAALLRELLEKGEIQPEVAAVARDYLSVLERKVLDVGPDVAGLDPVRAWGKKLLHLLRPRLVDRLPDARPTGPITSPSDYVGCYVEFAGPEHEDIKLWLYVTAAGGKYSVPGAPDALWLAIGPPGPALLSKADPPVFELVKDITGFPAWRASLPVDEIQAQGSLEEEVSSTLERVTRLLVLAGVAQTG